MREVTMADMQGLFLPLPNALGKFVAALYD
jgi:hypothetical protein